MLAACWRPAARSPTSRRSPRPGSGRSPAFAATALVAARWRSTALRRRTTRFGGRNVREIPIGQHRRMDVTACAEAIAQDRKDGVTPVAVVATAGTTLTG